MADRKECIATKNVALKGRLSRVRRMLVDDYTTLTDILNEIDGNNDGLDWKPGDDLRNLREARRG